MKHIWNRVLNFIGRTGVALFALVLFIHGSTKNATNVNNAAEVALLRVLVGVMTNAAAKYTMPTNAIAYRPWAVRGGFQDRFWLDFGDWTFPLGANEYSRVTVPTWGEIWPEWNDEEKKIAAVGMPMAVVPGVSTFQEVNLSCCSGREPTDIEIKLESGARLIALHEDSTNGPAVSLPWRTTLEKYDSLTKKFYVEALSASSSENDICLKATARNGTSTYTKEAKFTAIELKVYVDQLAPENKCLYRHAFGVNEKINLAQSPRAPQVVWDITGEYAFSKQYNQVFTIDQNGTTSISKFGNSASRTTNDVIRVNGVEVNENGDSENE